MEEIKLYRLKDGNGYTKVGTDEELISYHNDYVINSNNFKENESSIIMDHLEGVVMLKNITKFVLIILSQNAGS